MNLDERISSFIELGKQLKNLPETEKLALAEQANRLNTWFSPENVLYAFDAIQEFLTENNLYNWLQNYDFQTVTPKKVAVIMAGNIPMVGFHDFMSVLLAGHVLYAKTSSDDTFLIKEIARMLVKIDVRWKDKINFLTGIMKDFEAIIATGSDNSARYFEQYFGKYPNIIRKNRTSIAVLSGNETTEELASLGNDILRYYGLGCRNVSKIFVPKDYNFIPMLDALMNWEHILDNHRYQNNYDYNKSIYLVNRVVHLDTGFLLLTESTQLVSPISVLFYENYENLVDLEQKLALIQDNLQCITSKIKLANQKESNQKDLGNAQTPALEDYADGVDTMKFLVSL